MPIVKIPRRYLVAQDDDSITVDLPESMMAIFQRDYSKVAQAKGILKHKKADLIRHAETIRQEWE